MVTMLQVYKLQYIYWLKDACVWCWRTAFCHLEKPVAFEFFTAIVCGGDGPLRCIAVAAKRNRSTKKSPEGRPHLLEQ